MCYLDREGSAFVSLSAEHRVNASNGLTGIHRARRTVEVKNGVIVGELSPVMALVRRYFDPDLQRLDCGTFSQATNDPGVFPLSIRNLVGMELKELEPQPFRP